MLFCYGYKWGRLPTLTDRWRYDRTHRTVRPCYRSEPNCLIISYADLNKQKVEHSPTNMTEGENAPSARRWSVMEPRWSALHTRALLRIYTQTTR